MAPSDPFFPIPEPADPVGVQAREVPGTATANSTGNYRHVGYEKLLTLASHKEFPITVFEAFNRSLRLRPERALFGWRASNKETGALANEFSWMDHREVDRRRKLIGSGLLALAKQGVIQTGGKHTGFMVAKYAACIELV